MLAHARSPRYRWPGGRRAGEGSVARCHCQNSLPRYDMRCLRALPRTLHIQGTTRQQQRHVQCSTAPSSVTHRRWPVLPSAAPAALRAALEDDARELCALPIDPACVTTLGGPTEFYEQLQEAAAEAQHRLLLASLYIGTGDKEQALLDAVAAACDRVPSLQATLLVDALRTQRVERSGVSSLDKIIERCGRHIATGKKVAAATPARGLSVFLYHTHMLGKIGNRVLPPRWNEGISLQHCKVYLFDNTVILSGANLSDTYFTDRDDRYVVFTECAPLADYVHELFASERGLPAACYTVQTRHDVGRVVRAGQRCADYELVQPALGYDPVSGAREFGTATARHLRAFLAQQRQQALEKAWESVNSRRNGNDEACTWIVPALQFAPHGIAQDEPLLSEIVSQLGDDRKGSYGESGSVVLSSAYLNLTSSQFKYSPLAEALAASGCKADVTLVLASDESHGFSGATGLSAYIPQGYALLRSRLQRYLESVRDPSGRRTEVRLHRRLVDGKHWSFHCKALWYTEPAAGAGVDILEGSKSSQDPTGAEVCERVNSTSPAGPGLTVVGSSNFGRRSMARDLEAQFWLVRHKLVVSTHAIIILTK